MTDTTQDLEFDEEIEADPVDLDIPESLPVLTTAPVVEKPPANPTIISYFTSDSDWDFCPPTPEVQLQVQELLAYTGIYKGKLNGKWGNLTVHSINAAVGRQAVRPDLELCVLVRDFAEELGGYKDDTTNEAVLTQEVWEAFVQGLLASDKH